MKGTIASTPQEDQSKIRLWLTSEVAALLRLHEETIRRALRQGRIEGEKFGRTWRISAEVTERLVREGLK